MCVWLLWSVGASVVLAGDPAVRLQTTEGEIDIRLFIDQAPVSVTRFLDQVEAGQYNGNLFHRVVPGFVIQTGGYNVLQEALPEPEPIHNEADNGIRNLSGTIAFAREDIIDSASRQFFINTSDNPSLDHSPTSCTREDEAAAKEARARGLRKPVTCKSFGYAVFGRVVEGMDIVDLIELADTQTVEDFDDVPVTPVVIVSIARESAAPEEAIQETLPPETKAGDS